MVEIQMVIINEFGEFFGRKTQLTTTNYESFIEMSRNFYNSSFELTCDDGVFMVFPPQLVQKSILKINSKIIE